MEDSTRQQLDSKWDSAETKTQQLYPPASRWAIAAAFIRMEPLPKPRPGVASVTEHQRYSCNTVSLIGTRVRGELSHGCNGARRSAAIDGSEARLLHLPHRVSGQRLGKLHSTRALVWREAGPRLRHDLVRRQLGARRSDDDRRHSLAPIRVRQPDHGAVLHATDRAQGVLYLRGIDVQPPADDQVFGAAHDFVVAIRVLATQVAGTEPAVHEGLGGLLGRVVVTGEHNGTQHPALADIPLCDIRPFFRVDEPNANARQRHSDLAGLALALEGIGGVHPCLRQSIPLEDGVARSLPERVEVGDAERRR